MEYTNGIFFLTTEFDVLLNCERFLKIICNQCGVSTKDTYSSRHLVLSNFGTCTCCNVETYLYQTSFASRLGVEHPSTLIFYFHLISRNCHKHSYVLTSLLLRRMWWYCCKVSCLLLKGFKHSDQ